MISQVQGAEENKHKNARGATIAYGQQYDHKKRLEAVYSITSRYFGEKFDLHGAHSLFKHHRGGYWGNAPRLH